MNADEGKSTLRDGDVTERVIGAFFEVYNELGSGFLESVYQRALAIALASRGMHAAQEWSVEVHFRGNVVGVFRPDLVVEDRIIVEVKAGRTIDDVHRAQLLNYLRASSLYVGLLLNFGPKPTFARMILEKGRR